MKIAQICPLYESCPPRFYGGTERVVSYLTEELVRQGHERGPLPWANWLGTIYHGLPSNLYELGSGSGGYLAFIGRICPEKRPDRAIEIACRAGVPLRIAAKVDKVDRAYHEPRLNRY
jgi:glycosyltransferase involved in cell wall biosynthesis